MAASAALPPSRSTSRPIRDARVSGEHTAWRVKRGTASAAAALAERPEERPDVLDQGGRLLHRREMSAALEAGPVRHVVEPLRPAARRLEDLPREDGATGRHRDAEALRRGIPPGHHLVRQARRRRRRLPPPEKAA